MAEKPLRQDSSSYYEDLLRKALNAIDAENGGRALMVSTQMRVDGDQKILAANIKTLQDIIAALRSQGESVFDQIPWLDINQPGAPMDYATKFNVFWRGLISSGKISRLVVPAESRGARGVESEIQFATESGIDVTVRSLQELLTGGQ